MQQETWRYPCELSYWIEHQTEVVLKSEFAESLNYALDRFVADEASGVRLVGPEFQLLEEPAPHWRRKGGAEPPDIPPLERTGPAV